jgi:hypothetical protein
VTHLMLCSAVSVVSLHTHTNVLRCCSHPVETHSPDGRRDSYSQNIQFVY